MAKTLKTCRVCGKTYEACRTVSVVPGVFRWQEVACSPECGAIYLKRVRESRNAARVTAKPAAKKIEIEEAPVEELAVVEAAEEPVAAGVSIEAAEAPESDEVKALELEAPDIDPSEE